MTYHDLHDLTSAVFSLLPHSNLTFYLYLVSCQSMNIPSTLHLCTCRFCLEWPSLPLSLDEFLLFFFQLSAQMSSSGFLQTARYSTPILCWHHTFTSLTMLYCYLIKCIYPTRLWNLKEQGPYLIHLFYCIILQCVLPKCSLN